MSRTPWHKHYHQDALLGMASLSVELRGVYYTLLDLMYDRKGPLAESDQMMAARMCCSVKKWQKYREALLDAGKIHLDSDGRITNNRFENELKISCKRAENGAKGGRARHENQKSPNENNASTEIGLKQTPKPQNQIPEKEGAKAPSVRASEFVETTEAIWKLLPSRKRKLTSKAKLVKPVTKILKAGHSSDVVIAAVARCYSEPRHKEDGGQFAPAAYSFLADGVWENYAPQVAADGADPDLSTWQNAMRLFVETGQWSSQVYGPKPGEPGCRVPDGLLNYWRKTQEIAA